MSEITNTPNVNNEANSKLSFMEKMGFASGDAACNFLFNPITMFLSFFYTDIFGLTPAIVATMFLVVRIVDAFFDPIYGAWMDSTRPKYGRYRTWMIVFTLPFAVSCLIMFYTPDISDTLKVIYAFVTYTALSILYSCVNMPYCSLGSVITADPVDRITCQKYRFIGAGIASVICTFSILPLVGVFGGEDKAKGFFYTLSIFALVSVVLFFFCFLYTRERVKPREGEESETLAQSFKKIVKNDQWFVSISLMFLDCMPSFIRGAASIYFAKYVLHFDDFASSIFLTVGIVASAFGTYVSQIFTNRYCKVAVYKYSKALCIPLSLVLLWLPSDQVVLIYLVFIILSIVHQIGCPLLWSFIGDVDDYGAYKLKQRASGLCAAGHLFTLKLALAIGGGIVGMALSIAGYEANEVNQSASSIAGIYALMTWIPICFYALTFLLTHFGYKLNRETMAKINRELYKA